MMGQSSKQATNLPGYTGFKPRQEEIEKPVQREGGSKVPGYCGYIPGVKSENLYGKTYGKSSK